VKPVVAIAAAVFVGPAVYNSVFWSLAGSTSLGVIGGGVIAGAAAGATVGAIAGGLYGGPEGALKGAFFGGISGGIFGGLDSFFGAGTYNGSLKGAARYGWSPERVVANSLAGGLTSELEGGRFSDGFKSSFATSALSYIAVSMRAATVDSSAKYVDQDGVMQNLAGRSVGFQGDGIKTGGARLVWNEILGAFNKCDSPMGGCQGGDGRLFWMKYAAGSWQDRLVESFGGVHDSLNSPFWYNASGNGINYTGVAKAFGETLNALNVVVAAPIVGASVLPTYSVPTLFGRHE